MRTQSDGSAAARPLTLCPADAVAPDTGGIYPHYVPRFTIDPWPDPGVYDRRTPSLCVHMVGRTPDQHGPSRTRLQIKPVDLEGDVEVGVRDTGSEVLIGVGILGGAENDRTFVKPVLNWQRHGPVPAAVDQSPEPLGTEQAKAFSLVQALHDPRRVLPAGLHDTEPKGSPGITAP